MKNTDWYSSIIKTAYTHQLIDGFEDGSFRPNDPINREQAMVIAAKAMIITGLSGMDSGQNANNVLRPFSDSVNVASWAQVAVADSVIAGIVSGRSSNDLAPKAKPISQEQKLR